MNISEKGVLVGKVMATLNSNVTRSQRVDIATQLFVLVLDEEEVEISEEERRDYFVGVGEGFATRWHELHKIIHGDL